MSGGTRTHDTVAGNFYVALHAAFRNTECAVFSSDMRVQVEKRRRYTCTDISAACGVPEFTSPEETTLVNPALVVEVLSSGPRPTTAATSLTSTGPSRRSARSCSYARTAAPPRRGAGRARGPSRT